jgi:hypothetical protein
MVDVNLLEAVEARLREFSRRHKKQSFGGFGIIIMGDFFQLPPVGSSIIGHKLLNNFRTVQFTQQMRQSAPDQEEFRKLLSSFRDPISSPTPISTSDLLGKLKRLSANDIDEDPAFEMATIVVASNKARHAINREQAIRFARRKGVPVMAFRLKPHPLLSEAIRVTAERAKCTIDSIYDEYPELTMYVVPGAPGLLTSNMNVDRGLSNGTRVTFHSVVCDDPTGWENYQAACPGEIVLFNISPTAINVEVPTVDFEQSMSISPTHMIIPLTLRKNPESVEGHSKFKYFDFGVDMAFAVTFYKVQGQTLERIIIDLNSHGQASVGIAQVYVGISRVKKFEHIRIFPVLSSSASKINKLKYPAQVVEWYRKKIASDEEQAATDKPASNKRTVSGPKKN